MPQPDGTDRPQVDWWWDGSGRGYFWVWLLGLAGVVVLFSVAVLLTAGGAPIRSVALANLESGLGVALLPTLIALRRLDRRRRLGTFGVPGDHDVRRALQRSLAIVGLVDERPPEARPEPPPSPVRPRSWYLLLAACWAGFVLLDVAALWVTARGLIAVADTAELAVGVAVIALPVLLGWLVVGLVALGKAARVAHWAPTAVEGGRHAAPRRPLRRRLAAAAVAGGRGVTAGVGAGTRWAAAAAVAAWHALRAGLAAGARLAAAAAVAAWRALSRGVAAAARWTARVTPAAWRGLSRGVAAGARRAAPVVLAGWRALSRGVAVAAGRGVTATLAGWRALNEWVAARAPVAARAMLAGWRALADAVAAAARQAAEATVAAWRAVQAGSAPAARRAADATSAGRRELAAGGGRAAGRAQAATVAAWRALADVTLAVWRRLTSGAAAGDGGGTGQALGQRLADDGRRAAGVTLARWRDVESGSRR
jgi:hypothetical protein